VLRTAAFAATVLLGCTVVAGAGSAATARTSFATRFASASSPQVSSNWAGYAAVAPDGAAVSFANVTGTWVVPRVTCTRQRADAVAFWVGLGGYAADSNALEQLGTAAQCDGFTSKPMYYAWWEIVPAVSVQIPLKVRPGDTITAAVAVSGAKVVMSLKDVTRKTRFSKVQTVSQALDITSAEWIAEAPADCGSSNSCQLIKLSNFGAVTFSKIAATGNSLPGTLAGPQNQPAPVWVAMPITLVHDRTAGSYFDQTDPDGNAVGAVPGDVSTDGRSFSVTWSASVNAPGS
jgi:hypothetical protein